jgi:hypothetical protein
MRGTEFDSVTDSDLHALVVDTMANHPEESLEQVLTRLRVRMGRTIEDAEVDRLREFYQQEGASALSSGIADRAAARATSEASLSHFRPNANEIVALVAGVLPFFVHLGAMSTTRGGAASYFDLFATAAGLIAIGASIGAILLVQRSPQRNLHFAFIGVLMVLGVYQTLLGLGLLHRFGVIPTS